MNYRNFLLATAIVLTPLAANAWAKDGHRISGVGPASSYKHIINAKDTISSKHRTIPGRASMSGRRSTLGRGGTSGRGSASGRSSTSGRGGAVGFERSGSSARGNNTFHSFGIKNYITSNGKQLPGYQRTTEDPIQKIDYGIQKADYGGNYKTDYRGDPRSDYRHDYSDPNIVNPYIDETGAFAPKKK